MAYLFHLHIFTPWSRVTPDRRPQACWSVQSLTFEALPKAHACIEMT